MRTYIFKIASEDGFQSYRLPLIDYEWETVQAFRSQSLTPLGASYGHHQYLGEPAPITTGRELVRFAIVKKCAADADAELRRLKAVVYLMGLGRAWVLDPAGDQFFSRIAPVTLPDVRGGPNDQYVAVNLEFERYTPWFAKTLISDSHAVVASPATFVVNNPGNIPVTLMNIELRSQSAAGFTNPIVENLSNGYRWSSTRDATSTGSRLRVNTERMAVDYSNNGGASWASDYGLFTNGLNQIDFFVLSPGDNTIQITSGGTPNMLAVFEFYAPYLL